jgi:DNA-binding NarL/FixJ family response regulator
VFELAFSEQPDRDLSSLTRRETEVLETAAVGLTNVQIASQLQVTVHAVKFHLAAVYRKLGVRNRTEAAAVYLRAHVSGDGTGLSR